MGGEVVVEFKRDVNILKTGVTIKRKKIYAFKFCIEAWIMLSDKTGIAPNEFGKLVDDDITFRQACYCAAKAYCLHYGKLINFTENEIHDVIEKMTVKQAKIIMEAFLKSRIGGKKIYDSVAEAYEEVDEKKN